MKRIRIEFYHLLYTLQFVTDNLEMLGDILTRGFKAHGSCTIGPSQVRRFSYCLVLQLAWNSSGD